MKNKFFLSLLCVILILSFVVGCGNNNNETKNDNNNEDNQPIINENISDSYTTIESSAFNKIRFKTHNPTFFWNSEDDFGSDIDTTFVVSKGGEPVENYYDIEELSVMVFGYDNRHFSSSDTVKKLYKYWYGITELQINYLENNIFSKHIKGETDKIYVETYCMIYNDIPYAVVLRVYKKDYTQNELKRIISEFHTIINTLEILES